jgi:hypothetical protein
MWIFDCCLFPVLYRAQQQSKKKKIFFFLINLLNQKLKEETMNKNVSDKFALYEILDLLLLLLLLLLLFRIKLIN